jgi:predicted peptidase
MRNDLLRTGGLLTMILSMLAVVAGSSGECHADETDSLFRREVFTSSSGESIPYRLMSPQNIEPGGTYPLVLFLHGAGERGTDNDRQLVHVAKELATPELRKRYPVFVIAPQCPEKKRWVEVPWEEDQHLQPEVPSDPMKLVIELLDESQKKLPIDPNRIYYVGLSMGGFGVWDLAQRQPDRCAGVIPICGGGDRTRAHVLKDVPVWAFHGDSDAVVKVFRSRDMIQAIREAGGHPVYTEYPGVGHNSWTQTAKNPLVWDWLFAQSRQHN